jgi:hypothetical protein
VGRRSRGGAKYLPLMPACTGASLTETSNATEEVAWFDPAALATASRSLGTRTQRQGTNDLDITHVSYEALKNGML